MKKERKRKSKWKYIQYVTDTYIIIYHIYIPGPSFRGVKWMGIRVPNNQPNPHLHLRNLGREMGESQEPGIFPSERTMCAF